MTVQPSFQIVVIPGDGIGPEVTRAAVAVLQATGLPLAFAEAEAGWETFQRHGVALPKETLVAARQADAILFGAVASPSHPVQSYRSPIVGLRRALDLYANIRPTTSSGQPTTIDRRPVDLVVVRENTEGLYAGRERVEDNGDTAITERVITRRASERIARAAFELARSRGQGPGQNRQPKVTVVHKANVLRETCGLFRSVAFGVAEHYRDVQADELLVDTAALQLVQRPERFDVVVTTNLFGDILSDVACYWGGGMGLATSANMGETHALFEPVHGAAPDIAGKGIANPLAAVGCAAMLLEWLGNREQANGEAGKREDGETENRSDMCREAGLRVRSIAQQVLAEEPHTPDLGGKARTEDVTNAVITRLSNF